MGVTSRIPEAKRGGIFKRMETDPEYRARLIAAGHGIKILPNHYGRALDELGDGLRLQRRIVESSAD